RPALLHLPRRLRDLRLPLLTGRLPGAGRHGQHRGRVRAPVEAGQFCPADRGSCAVRARGRMSRMSWRAVPGPERLVPLKGIYDRPRSPGSLVVTTGTSFPSGHAVAASVTVIAAVIALLPPGRRRAWWVLAAVAFSILMGLSRAYLGAHWLSDAVAGILLGISCAVVAAVMIGQIQRRVEGKQGAA